ncbi:NADAR family protein [Allostreptomyces psammosilenae]|uniref:NADAR domain-containing protein n=1 Tax=Allostreptomyces psammosilenae TaxID=1892865 RepID=A0A852ZZP0_9ACTN|nr:NADAR family protein [Allostreptomyces psammosilenae]NYI06690.1 hypothetical protein [Allostreptomyces psammosilenae]
MTATTFPHDVDELIRRQQAGERIRYLFFWGHQPAPDGSVGRGCLSQWWPSPFTVDGVTYATAEHWMMAGKARLFGDDAALAEVLSATHPSQAKAAGRRVRGFDDETWAAHRMELVTAGNVAKFASDPELTRYLLSTGDRVLVEASPRDHIWGIGLAATDPAAEDPTRWRGTNLLGFALMAARAVLAGR